MLFKHIKSKEKVSTIIGSWIMNIRNLIHSLQLDEVNQTWPPDMIPGHIQRILVDQEMVQNVQEMSRRSRKCVMGLWTFVWRSMKCVNRYRKWLQSSGVVWAKPIPTGSHVVATTTLVAIDRTNCVCCTSRPLARYQEVQNNVEWIPKRFAHAHSVSGAIDHSFAPREGLVRCSTHNLCGQWRPRLW